MSRPLSQNHGLHGAENDEQIQRKGQILDVEEVVLQFLQCVFDACAVRVAHLCPSGQTRPHNTPLSIERNLASQLRDELRSFGARSHETHVALQHVPELWQFIETAASEE